MRHITEADLDQLRAQAVASPRRRAHLLLHEDAADAQRILIAVEPDSYFRPHLHPPTPVWSGSETLCVLSGRIAVLGFAADGRALETTVVETGLVSHIPGGQGHGLVALDAGTVVLEVKPGHRPDPDRVWLPGYPAEEDPAARDQLSRWRAGIRIAEQELTR